MLYNMTRADTRNRPGCAPFSEKDALILYGVFGVIS
jgi:hypothetical protein